MRKGHVEEAWLATIIICITIAVTLVVCQGKMDLRVHCLIVRLAQKGMRMGGAGGSLGSSGLALFVTLKPFSGRIVVPMRPCGAPLPRCLAMLLMITCDIPIVQLKALTRTMAPPRMCRRRRP